ncbi:hypothetical protein Spla01_03534 [Streptomyces platensis]|uniref:Uncharacterized protein n=1 Tax=Streptomyces platensis TaxID=58346 RepID=A0ABX3Y4C7_STRPT|nr:hypothetical protein BG653_00615 [Streptomyces platensis]
MHIGINGIYLPGRGCDWAVGGMGETVVPAVGLSGQRPAVLPVAARRPPAPSCGRPPAR